MNTTKNKDLLTNDKIDSIEKIVHYTLTDYSFYVNNQISEDFIREIKDNVHWSYLSLTQRLSESFIREFQDKVDLNNKLNDYFIKSFENELHRPGGLFITELESFVKKLYERTHIDNKK